MTGEEPSSSKLSDQLAIAVVDLLGDRQWHPYAHIMRELMKVPQPGVAVRRAEQLRTKRRGGDPAKPPTRRVHRDTEDLVRIGARDIVRGFLANERNFETNKTYPSGARPAGFVDDKMIRMIEVPVRARSIGEPYAKVLERQFNRDKERNRLLKENEHLRDQVANLRIYLIGLGHEPRANEIAPPEVD